MNPQSLGSLILKYCFYIFAIVSILFFIKGSFSSLGLAGTLLISFFITIFIGLFGYLPIALVASKKIQAAVMLDAKEKFIQFIGKPFKYLDVSVSIGKKDTSGSAIAYEEGAIYIMDYGIAGKIIWNDIRSWEWIIPSHTSYTSIGMTNATSVATANVNARTAAYSESGFFIDVIDIEKPKWQFMTDDQKLLTKWMKTFNQIKEGTLV